MQVIVIGGNAAGLSVALMLARAGHDVVVCEQDDLTRRSNPRPRILLPVGRVLCMLWTVVAGLRLARTGSRR